jgi:hypothetical protein
VRRILRYRLQRPDDNFLGLLGRDRRRATGPRLVDQTIKAVLHEVGTLHAVVPFYAAPAGLFASACFLLAFEGTRRFRARNR